MFGRLGWMEILIIVLLVFILFGHNKIPQMMKNLADGLNVFKKELKTTQQNVPSNKSVAKRTVRKTKTNADTPKKKSVKKK
ncbi:MAG: twin-arginine translocase TatA/TatE family subunit [Alphaproteobacteria bacterium]|nr:twin-arginine translocase TatA/TatE family subunit [Alphaproteobacteria bacterium]